MNNVVNNKRVFYVAPHRPIGFVEIIGKRDDVRLDMLEHETPADVAGPILSAAHAYQTSSTRDELARHYHTSAEFLKKTPNLLLVSTNGAGYDTVDVKACTERGILVVNQTGGNAEAVAEHVLGMMLILVKRVAENDRALRAGTFTTRVDFIGREAFGKTIGIIGLGNVGRRVAELCGALFRMQVIAYDPYVDAARCATRRGKGRTRRAVGARRFRLDQLSADRRDPRHDRRPRIRADAAACLFDHDGARLHSRRGGAGAGAARQEDRRRRPRRLGQGAAAGRSSAAEVRQRDRHRAHGRRHPRGPRPIWARSPPSRCSTRSTASR